METEDTAIFKNQGYDTPIIYIIFNYNYNNYNEIVIITCAIKKKN